MAALAGALFRLMAESNDFPEVAVLSLGGLSLSVMLMHFGFDLGAISRMALNPFD
jgi:hypothetical protein